MSYVGPCLCFGFPKSATAVSTQKHIRMLIVRSDYWMSNKMGAKTQPKVKSLREAVKLINDGDKVTFSGFGYRGHPVAMVHEMIRQGKKNLEIAGSAAWHTNNLLIGAGCVDRMLVCADTVEFGGTIPSLRRAVENGGIAVEDYSFYALACRLMASALGLSFFPTRSMLGSDMLRCNWLEKNKKFRIVNCPFSGERVVLVPPLEPDVAVIHAQYADAQGNVQLLGPTDLVDEQARASKKVIVTVEKVVSNSVIRRRPELTLIPSFLVDAVVEVPFGAHPTGMFRVYDSDMDHLKYSYEQSKDPQKFQEYLNRFVYGIDFSEYLKRIGGADKISKLTNKTSRHTSGRAGI
jgi:glutaconate CoA-transferase subunit A